MDYEKKYKEALEKARAINNGKDVDVEAGTTTCEYIFPELKESEDGRIRKSLVILLQHFCKGYRVPGLDFPVSYKDMLAWLEKQDESYTKKDVDDAYLKGISDTKHELEKQDEKLPVGFYYINSEGKKFYSDTFKYGDVILHVKKQDKQKSADKIEPKFHEGDWIVHHGTENIYQVVAVIDNQYQLKYGDTYTVQKCADVDRCARLWDITKDAKDGDVLANDHRILILRELGYSWAADGNPDSLYAYCGIKPNGNFELEQKGYCFCGPLHTHPATKEQCDLLFQKMYEAGYEWNAEKKELKKIEQETTWSEEDMSKVQRIYKYLDEAKKYYADITEVRECIDWLKSLKERI